MQRHVRKKKQKRKKGEKRKKTRTMVTQHNSQLLLVKILLDAQSYNDKKSIPPLD